MCGISGFFGKKKIQSENIFSTLDLMKNRGPNFSNYFQSKVGDNLYVTLLHSRLSIIDLNNRSNQPFEEEDNVIIFNGEIYNYIELKNFLIKKGEKFKSKSDTEVLLKYYKIYGEKCVDYFEGMWAFAIYDKRNKKIFLSRDRFSEKPLYYYTDKYGIYFASEIKFLKSLSNNNFEINKKHLNNFISLGYKSLFKENNTFFKNVSFISGGNNISFNADLSLKKSRYWKPKIKKNEKISPQDCIKETQRLLIDSLKIRLRADVPIAICLSGGVDSAALASILSKKFNYKAKTFSIIDEDDRYDESKNIQKVLDDTNYENISIKLNNKNFFQNLKKQILYHNSPVATISSYIHSLLIASMKENNFKVAISGVAADEIFTGYYDHYLQYFETCKKDNNYLPKNLEKWKENIRDNIRNPIFKDEKLYINNPHYRDHIYDGRKEINDYLLDKNNKEFTEKNFDQDLLTNRRLNELFHENTPLILNQEDLNSMMHSIENRSPFLDTKLFNFIFSIPSKFLIQKGFSKYILREAVKDILVDPVRLDKRKKGFNASINSLVNFQDESVSKFLLDKKSQIFEFIDRKKIQNLFKIKKTPNHLSKFIFSFISAKLFLDSNNNL